MLKLKYGGKSLLWNLKSIYGIGDSKGEWICGRVGVRSSTKLKDLRSDQVESVYSILTSYNNLKTSSGIHKNLVRFTRKNKERLVKLNTHRGRRLKFGYPSRGQRTRSNGRNSRRTRV